MDLLDVHRDGNSIIWIKCNNILLVANNYNATSVILWWDTPNKAFNKNTPREVFCNDPIEVYEYLRGLY